MTEVELRPQRVSDAKRFYEIIKNPNNERINQKIKIVIDKGLYMV